MSETLTMATLLAVRPTMQLAMVDLRVSEYRPWSE
jgi:hypothetical protein